MLRNPIHLSLSPSFKVGKWAVSVIIEFSEKTKRRQKKETNDQLFTPLMEPLGDLFPKFLTVNFIVKILQKVILKLSKFNDHNAQCEPIRVSAGII